MIEEVYQQALARVKANLDAAGAAYHDDDGQLLVGGHRVDLTIGFDGFLRQGQQVLAPLDLRIQVDNGDEDRFRIGTLGIGDTPAVAVAAALDEWLTLVAAPLVKALTAQPPGLRVENDEVVWGLYPGSTSVRGTPPKGLQGAGGLLARLVETMVAAVRGWPTPRNEELRSLAGVVSQGDEGFDLQAAVDGAIDHDLAGKLASLDWPNTLEPYVLKQVIVVRGRPR